MVCSFSEPTETSRDFLIGRIAVDVIQPRPLFLTLGKVCHGRENSEKRRWFLEVCRYMLVIARCCYLQYVPIPVVRETFEALHQFLTVEIDTKLNISLSKPTFIARQTLAKMLPTNPFLTALFLLVTTVTATATDLAKRSCTTFTMADGTTFINNTQRYRVSPAFHCEFNGDYMNIGKGSRCSERYHCQLGNSPSTLPAEPSLNITLPEGVKEDEIYSIITKSVPKMGDFRRKVNSTYDLAEVTFCLGTLDERVYVAARLQMVCVNGTLSGCDAKGPADGTAIQACRPDVAETVDGKVTAVTTFSLVNVTEEEAKDMGNNPWPVKSAAAAFWAADVLSVLITVAMLSACWSLI